MKPPLITDAALEHLRRAADWPDAEGTRYEIRDRLGRGGMGTVYLAYDRELDRAVALKVLSDPEPAPDLVDRLREEARILARLEHPGIVPVHDAGTLPDGRAFYVMKRVEGERLDRAASHAPLTQRLRWLERICEAVAFAHERGILHRDLKPENVMVGAMGAVLVVDWGLATSIAPTAAHSKAKGNAGTPGYMAPELSTNGTPDLRSEVFSLGAILYFLLADTAPPIRLDEAAARLQSAAAPAPLRSIAAKAIARDPAARYAGAMELGAEIERFLLRERVQAHRETPGERVARQLERYRTPIALIGAYLAMRLLLQLFSRRGP